MTARSKQRHLTEQIVGGFSNDLITGVTHATLDKSHRHFSVHPLPRGGADGDPLIRAQVAILNHKSDELRQAVPEPLPHFTGEAGPPLVPRVAAPPPYPRSPSPDHSPKLAAVPPAHH